jgi:hypothetical protein
MNYTQSLNSALSGLMQSYYGGKAGAQSGEDAAYKRMQVESEIGRNSASAQVDQGKLARMLAQQQFFNDPERARQMAEGLNNSDPVTQSQALFQNLWALPDNATAENLTAGQAKLWARNDDVRAQNDPAFRLGINASKAAQDGKLFSPIGTTGYAMDAGAGKAYVASQPLAQLFADSARSEINRNNRPPSDPAPVIGYDANGNMLIVDKSGRTATPVVTAGGAQVQGSIDPVTQAAKKARVLALQEMLGSSPGAIDALEQYIAILPNAPSNWATSGYQSFAGRFGAGDAEKQAAMAQLVPIEGRLRALAEKPPGAVTDAEQAMLAGQMGILSNPEATTDQKIAAARQALAIYRSSAERARRELDAYRLDMPTPGGGGQSKAQDRPYTSISEMNAAKQDYERARRAAVARGDAALVRKMDELARQRGLIK